MKIRIVRREGTKWHPLPMGEVLGSSLADYMAKAECDIMAAIYYDGGEEPVGFVSNNEKYVKQYKSKGFSIHSNDFLNLTGNLTKEVSLVAQVFPDSRFVEIMNYHEPES